MAVQKKGLLVLLLFFSSLAFAQTAPVGPDTTLPPLPTHLSERDFEVINVGTDTDPFWAISLFAPVSPPPATPSCPGPSCPVPTGEEFKWIEKQPEAKIFLLTVTNTLVSDTMKICWDYPNDFSLDAPAGVIFFESVFLEKGDGSPDFEQIFEISSDKKELLADKLNKDCLDVPIVAPTESQEKTLSSFKGKILPNYSEVKTTDEGLKRRTLVVSGYAVGGTLEIKSIAGTRSNEIWRFSGGATKGKIKLTIVPNEPGKPSEVWISTQLPVGVEWQKGARTAVDVAERMTSTNGNKYFFEANDEKASSIDGSSSSSAMAVLAYSLLAEKNLNPKVGITGVIRFDASIGPIGGANQKAKAANELGTPTEKFTFLVPTNQKKEVTSLATYTNLTVEEVSNLSRAIEHFTGGAVVPPGAVPEQVTGSKATVVARGLAPKIERSTKAKLEFVQIKMGVEEQSLAGLDQYSVPAGSVKPFELKLANVVFDRPLVLAVGTVSCEQIAGFVNNGKAKLDQGWWEKTKGVASDSWSWIKKQFGTGEQVQQGISKINSGQWLSGGAQITGAELARLLVGAGKAVAWTLKGAWITLREAGTGFWSELTQDVGRETVQPGTDGSTPGINIRELIESGQADALVYLAIDAKEDFLYPIGDKDWADKPELKNKLSWLVRKINGLDVNPANYGKGQEIRFVACQFETDSATQKQDVYSKDEITLKFGELSCSSLLDCLSKIDTKAITQLFGD
jgi:hypothetical protein